MPIHRTRSYRRAPGRPPRLQRTAGAAAVFTQAAAGGPRRAEDTEKLSFYRTRVFPRLMDWALSREQVEVLRSQLLEPAGGHVLEIGFGTGLNLFHYPTSVTTLTAVEPNSGMQRVARARIRRSRFPVDLRQENCLALPMEDGAFDCAVSTFTLCSLAQPEQALAEVFRVLKVGGRFFFLEHGLSPAPAVARWQARLNPLQMRVGGGCHLDRDVPALVRAAGFSIAELSSDDVAKTPRVLGHVYAGIAQRPAVLAT